MTVDERRKIAVSGMLLEKNRALCTLQDLCPDGVVITTKTVGNEEVFSANFTKAGKVVSKNSVSVSGNKDDMERGLYKILALVEGFLGTEISRFRSGEDK